MQNFNNFFGCSQSLNSELVWFLKWENIFKILDMMVQAKNFNFAANYIDNSSFDIFVRIIRLYILSCYSWNVQEN